MNWNWDNPNVVQALIRLIKANQCIWKNTRSDRKRRLRAWEKISKELSIPVECLKKKYKIMRMTFRKQLLRKKQLESLGSTASFINDEFYSSMSFLTDIIIPIK